MPLILESYDSLPYIDAEPSEAERATANKLIAREVPVDYLKRAHPAMPGVPEVAFSDYFQKEIERAASGLRMEGGIDLSRYEAPEEPSKNASAEEYRAALRNAYTSTTYLSNRHSNLTLLDEMGKNSWLIGNSQLEGILKDLDRELAVVKGEADRVNKARKTAQENSRGEIVALEETWKQAVGKMIEVQVATDGLRQEIAKRKGQSQ